ncbi:MAG: hypothetical protein JNM45_07355 [Rhizobiales bacterium]|nr:hypothetical protein [Hyphomicrobiales bacterium]
MTRPRHLMLSAALAVAFLSAGAFAQAPQQGAVADAHVTVIHKSETQDFAS